MIMRVPVSLKYKRRFLQWFMSNQLTEDDEVSWLLADLLADERALRRIQFVEEIEEYPKGMIISTLPEEEPFLFFKGSVKSRNIYTAYHEFQLYSEEAIYINFNFPLAHKNRLYYLLLREERANAKRDQAIASHLLGHLLEKGKKEHLKNEIDEALLAQDYDKFMYYSSQLKQLNENNM